jgi:hypothetical protein
MTNPLKYLHGLNPAFVLVVLVVANLAAHAPLLITDYFGEQDAARIANDSIRAAHNGYFYDLEAMVYSTPLYLDALRYGLQTGLISPCSVPFWMTFVSLIASAAITAALFIFVFRLTGSVLAAFGAALILQFNPTFWFNSLYGFATIVAFALFMGSLALFQSALNKSSPRFQYLLFLGAALMYIVAVMTKVDVLLASAIFCLPVWQSGRSLKSRLIWIGTLVLFSGLVFLLFNHYAAILAPHREATGQWDKWQSQFFVGFERLVSKNNLKIIVRSVGFLSVPTAFVGVVLAGWQPKWRPAIFWLVMAGLPLVLFWGVIAGNSARHHLVPSLFLCIVLALPLAMRIRWVWVSVLAIICVVNYLYYPPSPNTVSPSGRLLANVSLLKERVKELHSMGEEIARLPNEKVGIIGGGPLHPYFTFEIMRNSHYLKHDFRANVQRFEVQKGNLVRSFILFYKTPEISEIAALANRGYFLVVVDNKVIKELGNLSELQGRWVPLEQLGLKN